MGLIAAVSAGAVPAEGIDPSTFAAVAALKLVVLKLGRADSDHGRHRARPPLCTCKPCEI